MAAAVLVVSMLTAADAHDVVVGGWRATNRSQPSPVPWQSAHQCRGRLGADAPAAVERAGELQQRFRYTPVRSWRDAEDAPGSSVVVVLVCANGTSPRGARGAAAQASLLFEPNRLAGWHEHMLQPHNSTLLLLLARHYTVADAGEARAYARALGLSPVECDSGAQPPQPCARARLLELDEGYELYSFSTARAPLPSYALVGVVTLPEPEWVRALPEGASLAEWRTPGCNHAKFAYVQSNNFYVHHLFRLRVLDFFDFFVKVDTDVHVLARLPTSPAAELHRQRAPLAFTSKWPFFDVPSCAMGLNALLEEYLANETARCSELEASASSGSSAAAAAAPKSNYNHMHGPGGDVHTAGAAPRRRVVAAAEDTTWWVTEKMAFYGNFVAGWLGFWASPEVMHFSAAWYAHPRGQWVHRWTDQQFWHRALGLVSVGPEAWVDLSRWRHRFFCHKQLCQTHRQLPATTASAVRVPTSSRQARRPQRPRPRSRLRPEL